MAVVCTAATAGLCPVTHALCVYHHSLLDSTRAYLDAFPNHVLVLAPPPLTPYASSQASADSVRQTKKRRVDDSGAGWEQARLRALSAPAPVDDRRERIDQATKRHHEELCSWMGDALAAVQDERINTSGGVFEFPAAQPGRVCWREPLQDRIDVPWASLQNDVARVADREDLLVEAIDDSTRWEDIINRLVLHDTAQVSTLSVVLPNPVPSSPTSADAPQANQPVAKVVLPARSGFLLADYATWSDPSSGLARLGAARGGWDLLIIE